MFNYYNKSPGRWVEIIIGLLLVVVSLFLFALAAVSFFSEAEEVHSVMFTVVVGLLAYWLGALALRLVLNWRRKDGGLFSGLAVKLWVIFFGFCSIGLIWLGISTGEDRMLVEAASMLVVCVAGWSLVKKRNRRN